MGRKPAFFKQQATVCGAISMETIDKSFAGISRDAAISRGVCRAAELFS
jgi:hypothetical protein